LAREEEFASQLRRISKGEVRRIHPLGSLSSVNREGRSAAKNTVPKTDQGVAERTGLASIAEGNTHDAPEHGE
jgi:hypothetical protein